MDGATDIMGLNGFENLHFTGFGVHFHFHKAGRKRR